MNNKTLTIGLTVVAIISIIGVFTGLSQATPKEGAAGTTSSTNISGTYGFQQTKTGQNCGDAYTFPTCAGEVVDGGVLSTTTPASMTLAQSDLGYSSISDLLNVGAATITLPASSTLTTFLPNSGDRKSIAITNATSSAFNITIAGGTGTLFQNASTSAVILPLKTAYLFVMRKANTDLTFTFLPGI